MGQGCHKERVRECPLPHSRLDEVFTMLFLHCCTGRSFSVTGEFEPLTSTPAADRFGDVGYLGGCVICASACGECIYTNQCLSKKQTVHQVILVLWSKLHALHTYCMEKKNKDYFFAEQCVCVCLVCPKNCDNVRYSKCNSLSYKCFWTIKTRSTVQTNPVVGWV